jgi:hypothetical protein
VGWVLRGIESEENGRGDKVKNERHGCVVYGFEGKEQAFLLWGSQKEVLVFQMNKNCSY